MRINLISVQWALLLLLVVSMASGLQAQENTIGIFDLKAIHAVPLNASVVSKTETAGVVTEAIRFTSVPGVRIFAYMSYQKGAKKNPANMIIRNYGAESRVDDAKQGFVGVSVCAPSGNTDETKNESVGGVPFKNDFMDDPQQSWIYHHVVALTRMIDYLETRPEVDVSKLLVMGNSWSGWICSVLHGIDSRPCAYIGWQSAGYYADEKGMSGDRPCNISRKHYEMYAPAAYARYGTSPIFIGTALTDYFSTLDGLMNLYANLKCPKAMAVAPNRYHAGTSRNEYTGSGSWAWHWQGNGKKPPVIGEGNAVVKDGKLDYSYNVTSTVPLTRTEVMYSIGAPGHWVGRTWHRIPAERVGNSSVFHSEIPVYDPVLPCYIVGQVETETMGASANMPILVDPTALGIVKANTAYPHMLIDFEDKDDLYIPSGQVNYVAEAPEGQTAARITPFDDGTIHFLNIEPTFWKDASEIRFFLKGDGKRGPVEVFLVYDTTYFLYHEKQNYSKITLIAENAIFPVGWKEYVIPLKNIKNAQQLDSLFFVPGKRDLYIDGIRWQ